MKTELQYKENHIKELEDANTRTELYVENLQQQLRFQELVHKEQLMKVDVNNR
jgi:hypothetical protein